MGTFRSERASLPVAMLAILTIGSLVTVLVGTVVIGQRQTRFDQGFEQSLAVAETGLERMVQLVRSRERSADFTLAEVAVAGGSYRGDADYDGRDWVLTATGTASDGTSRTVAVDLEFRSVFDVAAYGRTRVGLRGSNSADSYDSRINSTICKGTTATTADPFANGDSGDTRMCAATGNGVVATNEELFLRGGVIDLVDRAEIHFARGNIPGLPDPLPGATGFCGGVSATCTSPKLSYFREPIELEPDPVVPPAGLPNQGSFAGPILGPGPQLYTNVTLDSCTDIQGTLANPTILYVTGTLTIPNGEVVNFRPEDVDGVPPCNTSTEPKPPAGLLIFSAGVGPALRFGNHASFSGAVYAPRATFSGGAAGNIYGSMVAGSIETQGGWNFHYDDALGDVQTQAVYRTSNWREQPTPTTLGG